MGRVTRFLQKNTSSPSGAKAQAAHHDLEDAKIDPNLAKIIDAWPHLPKHIKFAMVALVAVGGGGKHD